MLNLLSYIYPFSFGVCLLSLILWFFFRGNKGYSKTLSQAFLGGFLVYLLALAFSPAGLASKLLILFRDLMVLGLTSQFFNFFKTNKILFFGMLAALLLVFKMGYFKYLQQSYIQKTIMPKEVSYEPAKSAELDQDWELLVELKEDANVAELQDIVQKYNLTYEVSFTEIADELATDLDDYYAVNIPARQVKHIERIKNALAKSGYVDSVEENEVIKLGPVETAKQPKSSKRNYGVNDPEIGNLWGFDKMELDKLYELIRSKKLKPNKPSLIAILDTGVDSKHEDLKANFKSIGQKFDEDPHSHGSHCAGIAGAVSNNNKGIASFSPDNGFVNIGSVTVLNKYGMGTQRSIINGMLKAADKGADVLSMSLGGPSDDKKQIAYAKAVKYANDKGAIVVCAAGNENRNAMDRSPANVEGVIVVSAVDQNLDKASFSNEVQDVRMAVAAPGVQVYSTIPNNKYAFFNGTSMAAPYVSGLVGILKAINPELTTKEVYDILNNSGIKTSDTRRTGKFIQPSKAVESILK